jgi:NitT/TauT family transport system substrate-binding protein
MANLELKGAIKILADARDTAGTQAIFGGPYASGSLYADAGWLAKNPDAARATAGAILEAVSFLKGATPEQAIGALEKGICFVGAEICGAAFTHNRDAYNHAGVVTPDMAETVHRALSSFDQGVADAHIDLSATYTAQFTKV